ncbi:MAG: murein biosynthesis integral membrane protein MurJ [Alphaproteobacteria bacterium]|nr:murein biosynthesis integral membrane protein MurJ [Alphaproteobacteria bacterium]
MSLFKSAAKVGGFTMISRVLGFVRDQLVAFTLGTGGVAEAFFIAQRFPNLFRTLFAEGAFNSAFVPIFAKRIEGEGPEAARHFAQEIYSALLAWMVLFCTFAMLFMPWLIYVIAWGFSGSPEKLALTTKLTIICFPYLLFMSLTALQGGVLNSLHRFTAAAAAPILLNLVMIASNVVAWYFGTGNSAATGYIFAWGLTLSGLAQFLLLVFACRHAKMSLWPKWPKLTPDVKLVAKRSAPGIISGGIMQINLLIASQIATGLPQAVANLYYAERLYQLPLGIIGVAVGVVLLPTLARKLRAGDEVGSLETSNRALELSLFLTLPAAVALMTIAAPILHTVFEHGAFKYADTLAVTPAVVAFASGLPAFALTKVFQPGFFARENTATPMRFSIISVIVNIISSLVLSRYFGHVGIAIGTSLAAWTNALLLYAQLCRLGHFSFDARAKTRLPLIILSSLFMAGALLAGSWMLRGNFAEGTSFIHALWGLCILVGIGVLSYFSFAQAVGAFRISELKAAVKR